MPSAINVKVEIAFATQPYAGSPTWTDVTTKVAWDKAPIQITRGRSDELTTITPSQLSLTLDNSDGRFTAGYTSGSNYPNVKLGKRIRVSVNPGAGFTEIFDGFVDSWPVYWAAAGLLAYAPVTASDRLKKLGKQLAADNLISTYYLANSPTDYWMFADAEGTTVPFNRSGTTQLSVGYRTFTGGSSPLVVYGDGTGPSHDGLTALQIQQQTFGASNSPTYAFSETQSLSMVGYVRYDGTSTAGTAFGPFYFWDGFSSNVIGLDMGFTGSLLFVQNAAGSVTTPNGTANLYDGSTHAFAAVFKGLGAGLGGTISLYIDGALDTSASVPTGTLASGITTPLAMVAEDFGTASAYTCAHFATFPSALTTQNISDFFNAGLNAFTGDTTLQRTTRIAGLAGVTPVVTGTAGTVSMAPLTDVNGSDYLTLLQTVADTEAGLLFTQRTGEVRLRPRRDMQDQATKWTIAAGHYLTDLQPLLDDFEIVNDAIGDRPGGNQQHLTNATSVGDNGTYSVSKTLQTTDDNEVLAWAQWSISSPTFGPRFPQVSVDLMTHQSEIVTWLAVELGDRITLSGLPSGSAPATTVDLLLQGYTETLSKDTYTVQMNCSPLPPNVWKLGDATLGVLGSTTTLAY